MWVARRVPDGYIGGHANQARLLVLSLYLEQHLADCGERSDARDGGGSQLHDLRVLEAGGEVLLRVG